MLATTSLQLQSPLALTMQVILLIASHLGWYIHIVLADLVVVHDHVAVHPDIATAKSFFAVAASLHLWGHNS